MMLRRNRSGRDLTDETTHLPREQRLHFGCHEQVPTFECLVIAMNRAPRSAWWLMPAGNNNSAETLTKKTNKV